MRRLARHVLADLAAVYVWEACSLAARYVGSRYAAKRTLLFDVDPTLRGRVMKELFD